MDVDRLNIPHRVTEQLEISKVLSMGKWLQVLDSRFQFFFLTLLVILMTEGRKTTVRGLHAAHLFNLCGFIKEMLVFFFCYMLHQIIYFFQNREQREKPYAFSIDLIFF